MMEERKRKTCEDLVVDPYTSQAECSHCQMYSVIKHCQCKCRVQCARCKNWWMKPHQYGSNLQEINEAMEPSLGERAKLTKIESSLGRSSNGDPFETLPEDLLMYLLKKFSESATSPSELLQTQLVCKRFKSCTLPYSLACVSGKMISWIQSNLCDRVLIFLNSCVEAGSPEACYYMGMRLYYCGGDPSHSITLIEKAAKAGHAAAFYSLATIHFVQHHSDEIPASEGFANCRHYVCIKWCEFGRLDALREMGFILESDPFFSSLDNLYNLKERSLEDMAKIEGKTYEHDCNYHRGGLILNKIGFEWGMGKQSLEARNFIEDWKPKPRDERMEAPARFNGWNAKNNLCSNLLCGKKEVNGEFRRCNRCGIARYCSRACQEIHRKMKHYERCGTSSF